jgi:hypothetical protein
MKKMIFLFIITSAVFLFMVACAPVNIQKCSKEYTYDKDGKLVKEYNECVTQIPERMPPLHLKNKDLYE